ncbi:DUF4388 domain-containing protein [Chondromyces apiculatus]|uniref:PatA-like N-terminal domain-containing protein n=1 Tax=Chondromyces apiculatus DSM 436 TaxID=1192034 RepID=A0A017T2Y8_9BACT|nr:DUF4388 domain-containing protein [Chondromyces apiculatus]EYF03599.1 Hypothetical protein CAP_5390 [Chondromyces apiculatus DSM 436]
MSRRVLLVDSDVEALGELASALRARGVTVANANDAFEAVELAFKRRPDAILAFKGDDDQGSLTGAFAAIPELADMPILYLVDSAAEPSADELPRSDVDRIVSRLAEVSPRPSRNPSAQETRGDLQQVPLIDLLQLLSINRRSGMLSLTTPSGAGEVRLAAGEIIDAVYRRLEGEKALFRLLGERDGHFAFTPGEPSTVRRILGQTSSLLLEAMRQVDETRRRRSELAPAGEAFFLDEPQDDEGWSGETGAPSITAGAPTRRGVDSRPSSFPTARPDSGATALHIAQLASPTPPTLEDIPPRRPSSVPPTLRAADPELLARFGFGSSPSPPAPSQEERDAVAAQVTTLLQMPHHLDELLDEVNASDVTILDVLRSLLEEGRVRRVSLADLTTPFAPPEQLPVLRSLVSRLTRPGFVPPPTLMIATSTRRIPTLAHAVRRIADATVPAEPPPRASLPRPLGVLRLGDGIELSLMGLPAEDTFSPTWPLALHGAAAVVRLSDASDEALAAHCQALELLLLDAESLMGSFDIAAPGHIAALVRAALETAAGV